MKIAFFYLAQQGGGAALDTYELAVGLSKRSEVLCIVSSESDSYRVWAEEAGRNEHFRVIGVATTKSMLKGVLSALNYSKFHNVRKKINQFAPDIIYSHMGHPWERLIIPYLRCKTVFKGIHDVKLHLGESTLMAKIIQYITSCQSSFYVVFSNYSKMSLMKQGIDEECIVQTTLGSLKRLRSKSEVDKKRYNRFLFFGRLIDYKGIGVLFDSLKSVFKTLPNVTLVMAGRGDISKYNEIIKLYSGNIEIHNKWIPDEDIPKYFADIDFVVAPYIDASQSGVVVLSYSYGKPVVVSDSGGLPEQVKDKETGLIVKKNDSKAISEAIISLYSDNHRLEAMKEKAFDYSEEVSWDTSANILFEGINQKVGALHKEV